jgi:hypothetical protein
MFNYIFHAVVILKIALTEWFFSGQAVFFEVATEFQNVI